MAGYLRRTLTLLLAICALLAAGACDVVRGRAAVRPDSAPTAVPPGGPVFAVQTPEGLRWAEEGAQDLLTRTYRALRAVYGADPPYQWRVVYHDESQAPFYDLLAPPAYHGDGVLYLSQGYLAAPNDHPDWESTRLLGTMEGLALGFNHYFGLQNTDLDMGIAATLARLHSPYLWVGEHAADLNNALLGFRNQEDQALAGWWSEGRLPEGQDPRNFERQRQIALCRTLALETSDDVWDDVFQDLRKQGRPLNSVASRAQGNRLLLQSLRRVTGQDLTDLFIKYSYEN